MRQIDAQSDVEGLAATAPRVYTVVKWLAEEGASAHHIGRIVAELNDRLVRRALALVVARLEAEGHGRPPLPYAWLAAGSEGRRERRSTDQDNGPSTRTSARFGAPRRGLLRLAGDEVPGASASAAMGSWLELTVQPEAVWRRYRNGMETPHPVEVKASLFFDLRPIAGDGARFDL
jgi:CBS domain-containing protein